MYRRLRNLRIAVSAIYMVAITYVIIDSALILTPIGHMLVEMQLVPAIFVASTTWLMLWLLVTLTFGRVYCSTVCPMGAVQDVAIRVSRLGKGCNRRFRYSPPADMVRVIVASLVGVCMMVGIDWMVKGTDPFNIYRRIVLAISRPVVAGLSGLIVACVALLLIGWVAARRGRVLCNTICPAGALLALIGRQPVYKVDINTDLCTHCGKCEDVCRGLCIKMPDCVVDTTRCVMCLECAAICPDKAITVRRGRHTLSTPLMQKDPTMANLAHIGKISQARITDNPLSTK